MKRLLITTLVTLILIEVFLRLAFKITKGYDFFTPRYSFYKEELQALKNVENTDHNILILGGSAISNALPAKMGIQLEDSLKKVYPDVKVTDFGMPGRNSRDMALMCSLLSKEDISKVDLVIYYESINDSRYNCIDKADFKDNYSHSHWYEELALMEARPSMNYYFSPFVLDLFLSRLKERTGAKKMLNDELDVSPDLIDFGADIKTDKSFRNNLNQISEIFGHKIPIDLLEYHVYYPEKMMHKENLGFHKEGDYFTAEGPRTTSGAWGYPWNTIKAVKIHNSILKELANQNDNINFYSTDSVLTQIHPEYFDVCHFTEKGGKKFAHFLSNMVSYNQF